MSHTPGPWHVDGFHTSAVIRKRDDGTWERIAECDSDGFRNENWYANAVFIAAAPLQRNALIMVESFLHEVAEYLQDHHDVSDGDYGEPRPNRAMQLSSELEEVSARVFDALKKGEI